MLFISDLVRFVGAAEDDENVWRLADRQERI